MPHKKKSLALNVSDRELATILAALRYHQAENLQGTSEIPDQAIREIATDGGCLRPLSSQEIDRLCERINLAGDPVDWETCPHNWEESSGPTTGSGAEYWFRCRRCGATKYSSVEQDGSRSEEIHPPSDEDSEEVARGRSPRKSDQPGEKRPLNLARIIYDSYPSSDLLPLDPERDCRSLDDLLERVTTQDIGDTLFKFFVTEIVEGGEGTLEGTIRVLKRAKKDVNAVLQALKCAQRRPGEPGNRTTHDRRSDRAHLRIWRCSDCHRCLYRSYKKIAEAGAPYCPGCGREMRLA
jgi:hypothetical protein